MTSAQKKKIQELVKVNQPSKEVQKRLLNYWLKSYMTPHQFSKMFGMTNGRLTNLISSNDVYVKERIRKMLSRSICSLYKVNANRVNTLIELSTDRIESKRSLMQIIRRSADDMLKQYEHAVTQKEKDDILFKAGNVLKLVESVKDEEFNFIKKLAEMLNMDLLKNAENSGDEQIQVDKEIIAYIEAKNAAEQ